MKNSSFSQLPFVDRYLDFESLGSTNSFALKFPELSESKLTVIRARRQSDGRGQRGNSFFSDHEGGLWVSVVCPISDLALHFKYNRAMALAVAGMLLDESPGAPVKIKWPNDIYWGDRKICGMLLETVTPANSHIVIGIGLNVTVPPAAFPQELRRTATSLWAQTGRAVDIEMVLERILRRFHDTVSAPYDDTIHSLYRGMLYKVGARIEINDRQGFLDSVDNDGALILRTAIGSEKIRSGSIRFL